MGKVSKLTTWLHGLKPSGSKSNSNSKSKSKPGKQSADRPPHLPSPRPHNLTPTSSQETLAVPTQTCPFFAKLPGDIRRDILLLAFGNRNLHMDLVFDHPLVPLPPEDQPGAKTRTRRQVHAALNTQQLGYSSCDMPLSMHLDQPKIWRWGGTVCHRQPPGQPASVAFLRFSGTGPWTDYCQLGNVTCCNLYEGQWPDKCLIGIMGFLLSCRQAYIEGIQVLYGTNRIGIASELLLLNLPKLILPQRLASITSLELRIKGHADCPNPGRFTIDFGHLAPILDVVSASCPALRRLYLSIESSIYAHPDTLPISSLLQPIDAFFYNKWSHGCLRNMTIDLPKTTWNNCFKTNVRQRLVEHELEKEGHHLIWRCFDGGTENGRLEPESHSRSAGNWPGPPLQLPTRENEGRAVPSVGYWIAEGNDDEPMYMVTCS